MSVVRPVAGLDRVLRVRRFYEFHDLIGKPHDEPQGGVEPGHVVTSQLADPLPYPFTPNRDRLVGHHLRSGPQAILCGRVDGDAEIRHIDQP